MQALTMQARESADRWKAACNSHDLDRIMALYSETIVFKSPRVSTISDEPSGTLYGKAAVRDYWRRIFEKHPGLTFDIAQIFSGVDSIALEYWVGDHLRGIEFMMLNDDGLISFAAGNDSI
jgi:ketosteroid isomerase-like protein